MTGLLELSGRELERELQRIIKENPGRKPWTEKEREIALKLAKAGVSHVVIARKLGRTVRSIENQIYRQSFGFLSSGRGS